MYARVFILMLLSVLFLSGLAFATTCAYDSFVQSCAKCSFDSNGKMDEACSDSYQTSAKTCLGTDYPIMSAKYMMGSCPQIDECVSKLTACKEANRQGSNKEECSNLGSKNCFVRADLCAEAANKICSEGKTEEEAGWNNLDNATAPEQPIQNITNITQPNITQPIENQTLYPDSAFYGITNLCFAPEVILMLLFGSLFIRMKR